MAVSIVSTSTGSNDLNAGGYPTVSAPSSITAGNLLLAAITSGGQTWTLPSGWSLYGTEAATANNPQFDIFVKTATGSEPSTYTFTGSVPTDTINVGIFNISGANTSSPINGMFSAYSSATAVTIGSSGVSIPTALNCLPIALGSINQLSLSNSGAPAGLTSGWTGEFLVVLEDSSNYGNINNGNGYVPIYAAAGPLTSSTSSAVTASWNWGGSYSNFDGTTVMLFINPSSSTTGTITQNASAYVKSSGTITQNASAYVKVFGTKTNTASAYVGTQGTLSSNASAVVKAKSSLSRNATAYVGTSGTKTNTASAVCKAKSAIVSSASAYIGIKGTKTNTASAVVAPPHQSIIISGVVHAPTAQSITISGTVVAGQSLTISGIVKTPQQISISGVVTNVPLTLSGFVTLPITLVPPGLTFATPTSPPQTIVINQGSLSGPYTASSSNTGVATVTISGTNAIVTPIAAGTATITIFDAHGIFAAAGVSVGATASPVVLSTNSLVLSTSGIASTVYSKTFTASRSGDTGPFSVVSSPSGIVSVTGSGNAPGPITYTVTPLTVGTTTITVTANDGTKASLVVTVSGTLTAVVTSPKNSTTLVIAVSEPNYSGTLTPALIGTTSAAISPSLGFGPRTFFEITDSNAGEFFLVEFTDSIGNTAILSVQSKNVSLGPVAYIFWDETGINPVAAGVQYQVWCVGDPQTPANMVTSGFLGVAGTATLELDETTEYVINWIGARAPSGQTTFTTGAIGTVAATVTVSGYRSPNSSTLGYAQKQIAQWTRGWAGSQYKQPGAPGSTGNAYNLAYSFATILGEGGSIGGNPFFGLPSNLQSAIGLDTFLQSITVAMRLFNCTGNLIDSWFEDYLGTSFQRQSGETDALFLQRGFIALSAARATRTALNSVTNAAWQSLGNQGAIVCDDSMSNPTIMSQIGYAAPYFVVQLPAISDVSDAFFLDNRYLGLNTFLLSLGTATILSGGSIPALVGQAVESTRALGTIPIYLQYIS